MCCSAISFFTSSIVMVAPHTPLGKTTVASMSAPTPSMIHTRIAYLLNSMLTDSLSPKQLKKALSTCSATFAQFRNSNFEFSNTWSFSSVIRLLKKVQMQGGTWSAE
jgi:hypothetical protein